MQHSLYPGSCGSDEIRDEYAYDEAGNRTVREEGIRGKDSPPPPPPIYSANADSDPGPPKETFRYDPAGLLVEERDVRPSGRVVYTVTYEYDAAARLVEIKSYEPDGQLPVRRVYGYEANKGFPSEFTYYSGDGEVGERTKYTEYQLNSLGDWVKRKATTDEPIWLGRKGARRVAGNRHTVAWVLRQIDYYPQGE